MDKIVSVQGETNMASTINDIARHCGLAVGTISKYLNGKPVRPGNKEKIEIAIHDLDYHVNQFARGLKTNRAMTVGILVTRISDIFDAQIVAEVEQLLHTRGYGVIVCGYNNDPDLYDEKLKYLYSKQVDGIISVPSTSSSKVAEKVLETTPIVFFDCYIDHLQADAVMINNFSAMYMATSKIIERGHRKIAIIANRQQSTMTSDERLGGFMQALQDHGIALQPDYLQYGNYTLEGGHQAMNTLIHLPDPPTVVAAINYYMTMGAYMAISNKGWKIPDDISFLGFDKLVFADVLKPALSVVVQPMKEISRVVTELLLSRMTGQYTGSPVIRRLDAQVLITDSITDISG